MIKTFADLFAAHCRALEGGSAMKDDAVRAQLAELPDWTTDGKRMQRRLPLRELLGDDRVRQRARIRGPSRGSPSGVRRSRYDAVDVRFDTHSVGGISDQRLHLRGEVRRAVRRAAPNSRLEASAGGSSRHTDVTTSSSPTQASGSSASRAARRARPPAATSCSVEADRPRPGRPRTDRAAPQPAVALERLSHEAARREHRPHRHRRRDVAAVLRGAARAHAGRGREHRRGGRASCSTRSTWSTGSTRRVRRCRLYVGPRLRRSTRCRSENDPDERRQAARRRRFDGLTTLLVGQSGMGKSSLLNLLVPDAQAATREISEALQTGKHTTTDARLYALPTAGSSNPSFSGGAVIDTPGFQEFGLAHLTPGDRRTRLSRPAAVPRPVPLRELHASARAGLRGPRRARPRRHRCRVATISSRS